MDYSHLANIQPGHPMYGSPQHQLGLQQYISAVRDARENRMRAEERAHDESMAAGGPAPNLSYISPFSSAVPNIVGAVGAVGTPSNVVGNIMPSNAVGNVMPSNAVGNVMPSNAVGNVTPSNVVNPATAAYLGHNSNTQGGGRPGRDRGDVHRKHMMAVNRHMEKRGGVLTDEDRRKHAEHQARIKAHREEYERSRQTGTSTTHAQRIAEAHGFRDEDPTAPKKKIESLGGGLHGYTLVSTVNGYGIDYKGKLVFESHNKVETIDKLNKLLGLSKKLGSFGPSMTVESDSHYSPEVATLFKPTIYDRMNFSGGVLPVLPTTLPSRARGWATLTPMVIPPYQSLLFPSVFGHQHPRSMREKH